MPCLPSISSKKKCIHTIQARSTSGGATAAISQSSTATGSKSRYIMLPTRESPQESTVGPSCLGQWSSSQVKERSSSGERIPSEAVQS